jgi:hypothetical protein
VGPVRTVYGGDPTKNYVHPKLNTLIDRKKQTVRSVTGELMLDYGKGISLLNAPKRRRDWLFESGGRQVFPHAICKLPAATITPHFWWFRSISCR